MERYEPETDDGTLFLVGDGGGDRVEVGSLDDVVAAVGGETYTIEYDERQRKQPWLDTDDGRLDIEVRDAVTSLNHTPELVEELRDHDLSTERYGLPERTVVFADRFVDILEQQGKKRE